VKGWRGRKGEEARALKWELHQLKHKTEGAVA